MSCAFEERVAAFASGEPDDELAAHLPSCASCRAELEAARALVRELAPLGRPAEREGELFWADFTRGVRAQLPAKAETRASAAGRRAWLAAPALAAAALLVWLLAGREWAAPVASTPLPPAEPAAAQTVTAAAEAAMDPEELLPFDAPDATAQVAELDDAQLDAVLARLDRDDAPDDPDPFGALESATDDQLDAVADSFAL